MDRYRQDFHHIVKCEGNYGEWVKWEDHEKAVASLHAEITALRDELATAREQEQIASRAYADAYSQAAALRDLLVRADRELRLSRDNHSCCDAYSRQLEIDIARQFTGGA